MNEDSLYEFIRLKVGMFQRLTGNSEKIESERIPSENPLCVENMHFSKMPSIINELSMRLIIYAYYTKRGYTHVPDKALFKFVNLDKLEMLLVNVTHYENPEAEYKITTMSLSSSRETLEKIIAGISQ